MRIFIYRNYHPVLLTVLATPFGVNTETRGRFVPRIRILQPLVAVCFRS